jgi:hypothetical protein
MDEHASRKSGPELEARLRALGTPLPPEVTGAQLLQFIYPALRGVFYAKGGKDGQFASLSVDDPVSSIIRQLDSELPGGRANAEFASLLLTRVRVWVDAKCRVNPP